MEKKKDAKTKVIDVIVMIGIAIVVIAIIGGVIFCIVKSVNQVVDTINTDISTWQDKNLKCGEYIDTGRVKGIVIKKQWCAQRYQIRQDNGVMTWIVRAEVVKRNKEIPDE